jgi:adenylylsulfate kinase
MAKMKSGHPLHLHSENAHLGLTVWFTGLSGAGKSTLAQAVSVLLREQEFKVIILDADQMRRTLCADLGFSRPDRDENVLRIGNAALELTNQGVIVLVAVIAPYCDVRAEVRRRIGSYMEIFVDAPLQVCMQRDPKGLYLRAQRGEIPCFTGISDPYEIPGGPEVVCHTDGESIDESSTKVFTAILERQRALRPSSKGAGPGTSGKSPILDNVPR